MDFAGHKVKTKDGKEWAYNKIIFSTGGTPRKLPMHGFKTLGNVFVLRDLADVQSILNATGPDGGKNVVVIGVIPFPPSLPDPIKLTGGNNHQAPASLEWKSASVSPTRKTTSQ